MQNINRINFVFPKIYIHNFTYVYLIKYDLLVVDYWWGNIEFQYPNMSLHTFQDSPFLM